MRVLAVDIGTVRIGFAVSDPLGMTAQPLATQPGGGVKKNCKAILSMLQEYDKEEKDARRIGHIVLGHPLHLSGHASEMSELVEECARRIAIYCQQELHREIPVTLWDERLSSVAAEKELLHDNVSRARRKEVKDRVAAQLILMAYLEAQRVTA
jgi:putative holliday junction resolvase